jgi:hypothetical protein
VRKHDPAFGIDLECRAAARASGLENAIVHAPILLDATV